MLNSDMALIFEIEPFLNRNSGRVTCDWRDCPINEETEDITRSYAQNNQQWLDDFADAFELLILTGYRRSELLPVLVPRVTGYVCVFILKCLDQHTVVPSGLYSTNVLGAQQRQRGGRNHDGL